MKRQPLEVGTTIKLNSINYIVDTVIGDGATCIVYKAHYLDSRGLSHVVNIKECYPYADNVSRYGNVLKWESDEQRQNSISAFVTAYDKLMNRQLGNFTVHAFDIDEANSTQYIIMDANDGVTFDKDSSTSLTEILKTVKLLAHVVGQYHDNGYLHLDIKPSNFLVYPRPSEHIILFDIDSVTAIEDIRNGKISCAPYSKGWAAPEQMQGQINKLCPATDIYSIGAILFEKIMGRNVEPADTGLFADWDFDEKIFENVNPKIKRLLRNIFKKTLAANVKRRYQSIDELTADLTQAVETAEQKQYLIPDYIVSDIHFIGRENDLQKINTMFIDGIKAIFIHGFGGIGKTSLVKKYAELYGKHFDCVKFCRYSKDLAHIIDTLEIANEDKEDKAEHRKNLKNALKGTKTLLVIDNFDVENDEDLELLLSFNCNILFTTRNDYSYISSEKIEIIELESLPSDDLVQIFKNEYGKDISEAEEPIVEEIIERFGNLTFIVPIIAKQIIASRISISEFASSIDDDIFSRFNEENEDVRIMKDGKFLKTNSLDYLRIMFNIADLSEEHITVLRYLYLLRIHNNLTIEEYRKYTGTKNLNILNDLAFKNWISIDDSDSIEQAVIKVHQLVYDLTKQDLRPNSKNCCILLDNITKSVKIENKYIHEVRANFQYKKLIEEAVNRRNCENVISVLISLDYASKDDVNYIVNFLYNRFEGDLHEAQYCICEQLFQMFFSLLEIWKQQIGIFDYKLNSVIIFLYILYCMGTEIEIRGEEDEIPQEVQDVIHIFQITLDEFGDSNSENNSINLYMFLKPYLIAETDFDIRLRLDTEFSYSVLDKVYSCIDKFAELPISDHELLSAFSSYYHRHKKEIMQSPFSPEDIKKYQLSISEWKNQPIRILLDSLKSGEADKITAINGILSDETIPSEEKNKLIELVIASVFRSFQGQTHVKVEERYKTNWNSYIEPLQIHADFFDKFPKSKNRLGGKYDLCFNISRCRLAYVYAFLNDSRVSDTLEQVYLHIEDRHLSTSTDAWWNDKTAMPRFYVDFDIAIRVFSNIEKTYIILPYLLRYTELVINNSSSVLNFEETMMFEWYDKICVYSKEAYKQTKDKYYWQVFKNYEMKLKKIGRDSV